MGLCWLAKANKRGAALLFRPDQTPSHLWHLHPMCNSACGSEPRKRRANPAFIAELRCAFCNPRAPGNDEFQGTGTHNIDAVKGKDRKFYRPDGAMYGRKVRGILAAALMQASIAEFLACRGGLSAEFGVGGTETAGCG